MCLHGHTALTYTGLEGIRQPRDGFGLLRLNARVLAEFGNTPITLRF